MELKDKLLSRKLWVAVLGMAGGIAIAFGAPESLVNLIVGAGVALASVIIYIVTEGKIDEAAVQLSADFVKQLLAAIAEAKETPATTTVTNNVLADGEK